MSDLISRQEVSDIIKTRLYQTALNNDEYITSYAKVCEDIAENRIDTWINEAKSVEPEKCGDCISRTELLKKQQIIIDEHGLEHKIVHIGKIIDAPSVEPERKKGKWEYVQYDGNPKIGNWHCSNCRLIVNLGFEGAPYYDYCPGCGAKMEVDNG